ncbi:MAG: glycosyltransferase family 9 protein, partial [Pseudomonadota bacterium]
KTQLRSVIIPQSPQIAHIFEEFDDRLHKIAVYKSASGYDFDAGRVADLANDTDAFFSMTTWHSPSIDQVLVHLSPKTSSHGFFSQYDQHFNDHNTSNLVKYARLVETGFEASGADYAYAHKSRLWSTIPPGILDTIDASERTVVIHPFTVSGRNHSPEFWIDVIGGLLEEHIAVRFFVIGDERNLEIKAALDNERLIFVPPIFPVATYLISRCDVFVGIDSCFMHYADLLRRPAIGVFRSASIALWGLGLSPIRENLSTHTLSESAARSLVIEASRRLFDRAFETG